MTIELTFRDATTNDIPAIESLVTRAYRGEASRAGWTTEADLLDGGRIDAERLTDMLEAPRSIVLLAEHAGDLLACAQVAMEQDAGYFGMFAVEPTRQADGIGKRVLAEAERIVVERWAATQMRMTVIDVRDTLIAYYERRGYRRTGRVLPFPYGDERFGVPRRDDLRFEVMEKELQA